MGRRIGEARAVQQSFYRVVVMKRAEPGGKALNLPVCLQSYSHLVMKGRLWSKKRDHGYEWPNFSHVWKTWKIAAAPLNRKEPVEVVRVSVRNKYPSETTGRLRDYVNISCGCRYSTDEYLCDWNVVGFFWIIKSLVWRSVYWMVMVCS